jgi:DNA-binding transcriptional regulator YhcF (GntR family)
VTAKPLVGVWRDALRDSDLPSTPKLVALVLSTYLNGRGYGFPSRRTLAQGASLGSGLRSVDRAIAELEREGFLDVERSRGRSSHRYYITLPPTAHEMRRSEWATAQQTTPNRASGASNRAPRAPESAESAESGALPRGVALNGATASALCEECGVHSKYGHSAECSQAVRA